MYEEGSCTTFLLEGNQLMKKFIIFTISLFTISCLFADISPQKVTLSITTAVPEYLVHGFLVDSATTDIVSTTSVDDAFNQDGVDLTYAIKTNTTSNLIVSATITPFTNSVDSTVKVGIGSFSVESVEQEPIGTGYYQILDLLSSVQGMRMYSYTLKVKANQADVAVATAGDYASTLSIDIASN
jgi:hypothetical protein